MPTATMRTILAAAALLAASPALAQPVPPEPAGQPVTDAPRVIVTGTGEASAAPDTALLALTVLRSAASAGAALEEANAAMAAVIAAMREAGIERGDLQTSGFSINPQYRYDDGAGRPVDPPEIVGYEVRNSLTVRVREVREVGVLLDRAVGLGVNQGGEIVFTIEDSKALEDEARRAAVEDATAAARTLAQASGVTLGPVVSIEDTALVQPPVPMAAAMRMSAEAADAVPVETGENTIHRQVRMVFELQP